ncbi:neuromedin-K receptor-like isoform X2 [Contarinia nasturtii]|uniref:neuromedin-K receptor-like isoform X2 n=1 Tax=Contarinia nasturtii TaxID=265458 RepID=UPI0012D39377|nr:neuromedin-K receptor-like isoform X2 [Contarinia nasturtii]
MALSLDINQTITDIIINGTNLTTNETEFNSIATTLSSTDTNVDIVLLYGPKRDPLYIVIPITFVYMVIFVTGVVGNISTCIVIAKNKSMHTATNYYLFSLAISDFLLLVSGVPQEVYSIWFRYPYVFGEVFCVLRGLMAETAANATVLTITSFTVERYLAICHPFLQHTMSKLSRAVKIIIGIWILSISLAIPQALQFGVMTDVNNIDHSPMTLITVLYILIGLKLRTSGLMKRENGVSMQRRVHVNSCHRQQASVGTRRVLKMLVAVVVAFFFCWAPFHAQRLVAFYGNNQLFIYAIATYVSGVLYYLSTCINPLLYNIMSNKFREAFKETLANFCQLSTRGSNEKRAYRILSRSQRRWNSNQESGNYSGSSIRDESMHSTLTQKQSIDSMTSRCHSFKNQSSNQFKLKTNFKCKHNAINQSQNCVELPIDHIENATNENIIYKHRNTNKTNTIKQEHNLCSSPEINANNTFNYVNGTVSPMPGMHHIQSSEMLSMASNVEANNKKIRLTITPMNMTKSRRNKHLCYNKFRRSTTQPILRSWFSWFRPKRNAAFYSPPLEHPIKGIKINIHTNDNPNGCSMDGIQATVNVDSMSSSNDEEISNSSLQNVDRDALKDELAAYMDEIRAREKR